MASTGPMLHFVRCPKCLKVLAELPGASLYKCGGCGAILQAKPRSSIEETLSLPSAASSPKNISYNGSLHTERTSGNQTPSASDHSGGQDQAVKESVSGAIGEINMEDEFNVTKNPAESESNFDSWKEEKKSQEYVSSMEENKPEQGIPTEAENSLNEKGKKSSNLEISKASDSLVSSDKLEESSESHEHDTTSDDDKVNGKIRNNTSFLLRSSSSRAYDGSISSTDKVISRYDFQARNPGLSFASEEFHSALNFMASGNGANSNFQSKDAKEFVKFRYSEQSDQVKILRKVDELRSDLHGLFNRAANGKGASGLSASARFERQVSANQNQPSPTSSCLNPRPEGICCHNEHCKHCRHDVCCHLPEDRTSARPLHMTQSSYLRHEPQTLKSNDKRSQEAKRHCRPVSGGAPFVICYRCYNLLQLPADFLVSTKRIHKLRCGSCSEVLKYSFRPKTHSTTRTPVEAQLPPTEDEKNYSEFLDDETMAPNFNHIREGDPVSYSEEYDSSFLKSNSYEADPFRHLAMNSGSIVEEERGGKKTGGSQLHMLMGYSSARHLLFETLSPVEGHRTEQDR